jgi:tRNA(Ile)-lysidine synthase TilS/MesJ
MIDFSPLDNKSNIWISVSGGTDSALLLYLIVKHLHNTNSKTKVTPWCYVDDSRPGNDVDVAEIISTIRQQFNYKIEDLIVDHFYKEPGGDKVALTKPFWNIQAGSGKYDLYANALTSAPPLEAMQLDQNFYDAFKKVGPENRLDKGKNLWHDNKHKLWIWQPFINLNKRELADIYEEEDLMDNLFPLTRSCISRLNTPCYRCFWCYEKHWAFGVYDIKRTFNSL